MRAHEDKKKKVQEVAGEALVRRPAHGEQLRFMETRQDDWEAALGLDDDHFDQTLLHLSQIEVPSAPALAKGKRPPRRGQYPGQGSVLRGHAALLRACPEVQHEGGPDALEETARRRARYESLRHNAGEAIHQVMDLRLVLGGAGYHLLRATLQMVVSKIEDPQTPPAEVDRLKTRFSRLLLYKGALLQTREDRAAAKHKKKEELQAEAQDLRDRTLVEDVMESVRQGRMPARPVLEQAARIWFAMQQADTRRQKR